MAFQPAAGPLELRPPTVAGCSACRHFAGDAHTLERELPGLTTLGSGFSAVRASDGICRRHDRYVSAAHYCAQFLMVERPAD